MIEPDIKIEREVQLNIFQFNIVLRLLFLLKMYKTEYAKGSCVYLFFKCLFLFEKVRVSTHVSGGGAEGDKPGQRI